MVECKIITPEGKCARCKIDITRSIKHLKDVLCEDLELGSPDSHVLAFYTRDESIAIKDITDTGCTIVIEKRIKI